MLKTIDEVRRECIRVGTRLPHNDPAQKTLAPIQARADGLQSGDSPGLAEVAKALEPLSAKVPG